MRCYGGRMSTLHPRTLKLRSGEQFVDEREVELEPLELGGQRYLPVPDSVSAEQSMTRASTGTVFELRFRNRLHGPCYRCLADAAAPDVPDVQDVPRPRDRAASPARFVNA